MSMHTLAEIASVAAIASALMAVGAHALAQRWRRQP